MIRGPLTLARVSCRLDFRPKSILYYANRASVAGRYFPDLYADWQYGSTTVRLTDHEGKVRLALESGGGGFDADVPTDIRTLQEHFLGVVDHYRGSVIGKSKVVRFGWRIRLVTEHTSFEDLFPSFNRNITGGPENWYYTLGNEIRDSAFTIYYGTVDDGLNVRLGVLTAEQGVEFRKELEFKSTTKDTIATDGGALLIDIDRFSTTLSSTKELRAFLKQHKELVAKANDLADKVLNPLDTGGEQK